jgi:hypothetical protein
LSYRSADHAKMTALKKFVLRRVVVLIGLFLVAGYAVNQALAIALLTPPPPDGAPYPTTVVVKAWSYLSVSMFLFVFDIWLVVRTIKQVNRAPKLP